MVYKEPRKVPAHKPAPTQFFSTIKRHSGINPKPSRWKLNQDLMCGFKI